MTIAAEFNVTLQVIASLLIFVAGFLALVLCTIMSLVIAELISERAGFVRAYGANPDSSGTHVFPKVHRELRSSPLI